MNSPCKDCPRRHPAFHDACPEYQEYHSARQTEIEYTREQILRGSMYQETWKNQALHRNRGTVWGQRKRR